MDSEKGITAWIPLITKLVWPVLTILVLLFFHTEVSDLYSVVISSMKAGRSVEIGGFLKLGEAASDVAIGKLTSDKVSIKGIGGTTGVVRKSDPLIFGVNLYLA
jgi:hypothetical protein